MAKPATIKIRLNSTAGTGFFDGTKKNTRNMTEKLVKRKYDPIAKKHVEFNEGKIKYTFGTCFYERKLGDDRLLLCSHGLYAIAAILFRFVKRLVSLVEEISQQPAFSAIGGDPSADRDLNIHVLALEMERFRSNCIPNTLSPDLCHFGACFGHDEQDFFTAAAASYVLRTNIRSEPGGKIL